jgi:predicted phage tail component-like protein
MYRKYSILFNNKDSYSDLGLSITHRPNIPIAEESINTIEIEGLNGSLTEKYGTYKDIPIPIEFNAVNRKDIHSQFRQVKAWLQSIQDNKLVLNDDPDFFYKVNYITFDKDIERKFKVLGTFTATFVCKPFSYSFEVLNKITITQSMKLSNEGTAIAYPIMKIYGSGDITLTINNKNIVLTGITDNITLDSVMQEAYNDNAENLNNKMDGYFPTLDVGSNNISWIGAITKIELQPNWCYL